MVSLYQPLTTQGLPTCCILISLETNKILILLLFCMKAFSVGLSLVTESRLGSLSLSQFGSYKFPIFASSTLPYSREVVIKKNILTVLKKDLLLLAPMPLCLMSSLMGIFSHFLCLISSYSSGNNFEESSLMLHSFVAWFLFPQKIVSYLWIAAMCLSQKILYSYKYLNFSL